MRNGGWEAGWSSLVPIQPGGSRRPFFYVQAYMISVLELAPLAEQLGPDQPFYGLQPQGLDGRLPAHGTIEEMAAHYIAEMRAVQPEGPYAIGGHCSGSWVAFEMARQLERDGEALAALVLVDLGPPGVERPRMSVLQYLRNRIALYFRDRRLRHALAWQLRIRVGRLLLRRVGPSTARYEERVKEVHRTAYRRYEGGPVRSDLTLVLSSESLTTADKRWYTNWSMLTSGSVSTHEVGGTHANLLVQPHVTELAVAVVDALDLTEVDAV
jgi:thioesterase domain-containing protein